MNDSAAAASERLIARDAPLVLRAKERAWRSGVAFLSAPLRLLEEGADDVLAPAERALLTDRFAPARRQSFLAGRFAAKRALSHLTPGISARDLNVLPGALDQPIVSAPGRSNLQVTLSHAGSAAIALAHPEACPIGVDLEYARPEQQSVLCEQATRRELDMLRVLPMEPHERLMLLWCLKEALSKALRCGLTAPFNLLEVCDLKRSRVGAQVRFVNFSQYQGVAIWSRALFMAVVMPHNLTWECGDGSNPEETLAGWLSEAPP